MLDGKLGEKKQNLIQFGYPSVEENRDWLIPKGWLVQLELPMWVPKLWLLLSLS